jgi:hypothetical protein
MTIVIGQITPDEQIQYNISNYQTINKVCSLAKNEEYEIYIMNTKINDFGLILGTDIILDELFITYQITRVFYKVEDAEYILSASSYYGVKVYSLNE